jgi:hypothetical protein
VRDPKFTKVATHFPISYALTELQKDVEKQLDELPEAERESARTKFAIFVVHNKV